MAEFNPAFEFTVGHEGGFTKDARDPGNWTGGKVGYGYLKGTKWGLSAAAYPDLDIERLTREDARRVYLNDWWTPGRYGELNSQPIADRVFCCAVNMGRSQAIELLQIAVSAAGRRLVIDGVFGPYTLQATNDSALAPGILIALKAAMGGRYDAITDFKPAMLWAREGWLNRAFS